MYARALGCRFNGNPLRLCLQTSRTWFPCRTYGMEQGCYCCCASHLLSSRLPARCTIKPETLNWGEWQKVSTTRYIHWFNLLYHAPDSVTLIDVSTWTIDQVASWVAKQGFEKSTVDVLKQEKVKGSSLLRITEDVLRSLGIPFGEASDLAYNIQQLQSINHKSTAIWSPLIVFIGQFNGQSLLNYIVNNPNLQGKFKKDPALYLKVILKMQNCIYWLTSCWSWLKTRQILVEWAAMEQWRIPIMQWLNESTSVKRNLSSKATVRAILS